MSIEIIPATTWGRQITGSPSKSKPRQITELTIHYTGAMSFNTSRNGIAAAIKRIEKNHVARPKENMSTLGYNFLIDKWGRIWEGRGFGIRNGANGSSSNDTSFSVCLLVGVEDNKLPQVMVDAIRSLRIEIERRTKNEIVVRGHRDHISTSCPGEQVYRQIKRGMFSKAPTGAAPAPEVEPKPAAKKTDCTKQTQRMGSKGACVRELQNLLLAKGMKPGPADGVFGPKTAAAVRAFQKKSKLTVDGVVGPITWAALK